MTWLLAKDFFFAGVENKGSASASDRDRLLPQGLHGNLPSDGA